MRSTRPSGTPCWSDWMIERTSAATDGTFARSARRLSASWRDSPMRISPRVLRELVGERAVHVLDELAERRVQAHPCLDADGEQVEGVGQVSGQAVLARPRPRGEQPVGQEEQKGAAGDREQDSEQRVVGLRSDERADHQPGGTGADLRDHEPGGVIFHVSPASPRRRSMESSIADGTSGSTRLAEPLQPRNRLVAQRGAHSCLAARRTPSRARARRAAVVRAAWPCRRPGTRRRRSSGCRGRVGRSPVPLEGRDAAERERPDGHHDHAEDDQELARAGVEQRVEVARARRARSRTRSRTAARSEAPPTAAPEPSASAPSGGTAAAG